MSDLPDLEEVMWRVRLRLGGRVDSDLFDQDIDDQVDAVMAELGEDVPAVLAEQVRIRLKQSQYVVRLPGLGRPAPDTEGDAGSKARQQLQDVVTEVLYYRHAEDSRVRLDQLVSEVVGELTDDEVRPALAVLVGSMIEEENYRAKWLHIQGGGMVLHAPTKRRPARRPPRPRSNGEGS